jgi:UDP-glucose 4-epimerase
MITDYARLGKIKQYTIFRYFNVAGDAGLLFREVNAQNVFPLLAESLTNNNEFAIFGDDYATPDGTGVRDYIHLADLVKAHELALTAPISGIFNLGTGTGYSVKELVAAFTAVAAKPVTVRVAPRRAGDPAMLVADATKAKTLLGWQPEKTLREMVESTLLVYSDSADNTSKV